MPPKLTARQQSALLSAQATAAKKLMDMTTESPPSNTSDNSPENTSTISPSNPNTTATVITPVKKRNVEDVDGSEAKSPKTKKATKVLKELSSHNFDTNEGLLVAFRDVCGETATPPQSRQVLIAKIFDKYSANIIKNHFKTNYSHLPFPGAKAKIIQVLVQQVCNTVNALQGPIDSKKTPTNE